MNIHFKRLVCILLIICLMFTMTGCVADAAKAVFMLGQGLVSVAGNFAIAGIAWVVEKVTTPIREISDWCACPFSVELFRGWNRLIDPKGIFVDWRDIEDYGISFHDEHLERLEGDKSQDDTETKVVEGLDRFLAGGNDSDKNEITIHYDTAGGYAGPEDQIVKYNFITKIFKPKIAEEIPVRPGYHFLGWTRVFSEEDTLVVESKGEIREDGTVVTEVIRHENQALYFPGKAVDEKTGQKFTQDTTLHAVWVENRIPFALENVLENYDEILKENYKTVLNDHKYEIKQVVKFNKKTPCVTITCSCGMKVTEQYLTDAQFEDIWSRSVNSKKGDGEKDRLHKLYNAQHIGPIALRFNTSYYSGMSLDDLLSYASGASGRVEELAGNVQEFAENVNNAKPGEDLAKMYFEQINFPMKELEETAEKAGNIAEKASFAISVLQTASAFSTMLDEDVGILEQTKSMLETIDCISSFAGCDSYVSPIVSVLTDGLDLIDKVADNENHKNDTVKEVFEAYSPEHSPYLYHLFGNDLINLEDLVSTNETGCYCRKNPASCNFAANGGKPLAGAPSVFEVMWKMNTTILRPQEDAEKEVVLFYLAEKSKHELYEACGLTLEAYLDLVQE